MTSNGVNGINNGGNRMFKAPGAGKVKFAGNCSGSSPNVAKI